MMETKDTQSSIEKTMVGSLKSIVDDLEKDKEKESLVLNKKESKRSNVNLKVNISWFCMHALQIYYPNI